MERPQWEVLSVKRKSGKMPKEVEVGTDTDDDGICGNAKVNFYPPPSRKTPFFYNSIYNRSANLNVNLHT